MSCAAHREAIALLAGDDLARSERMHVEAHLKDCAACRLLLAELRAGVGLLKADPAVPLPEHVGETRRQTQGVGRRPWVAVAAAAAVLAGALAFPQVRLAVAQVLHLPTATLREQVTTWQLPGGGQAATEYVDADYLGTDFRVDPGPGAKVAYVQTADEARRLVGQSVLLPQAAGLPPGTESCMDSIRVQHVTDGNGVLRYAALEACAFALPPGDMRGSAGAAWYEAQFWPDRPTEKLNLVFGANWQVSTTDQAVNGRPARVIEATNRASGEYHSEVWLVNGDWLYKVRNHNPAIDIAQLIAVAGALR